MKRQSPNPVFWAIDEAARRQLSLADRVLLIYLARRFDPARGCWPSQPTLAADCGITERQVRRSRDQLRDCGLLRFTAGDGRNSRSTYWLLMPPTGGGQTGDLFGENASKTLDTQRNTKRNKGGHRVRSKEDIRSALQEENQPQKGGLVSAAKEDSESAEVLKKNPLEDSGLRPGTAVALPPVNGHDFDPRKALWNEGVAALKNLTGQLTTEAKKQIGRLLKVAGGDAVSVLRAIEAADYERPYEPIPWITAAVQARAAAKLTASEQYRRRHGVGSFLTPAKD